MATPTTTPKEPVAQVTSGDNASPGWSNQPEGSVQPELSSVLAHLEADRVTRQIELTKSEERFNRLEEWLGRLAGGLSRPHVEGTGGRTMQGQHTGGTEAGRKASVTAVDALLF